MNWKRKTTRTRDELDDDALVRDISGGAALMNAFAWLCGVNPEIRMKPFEPTGAEGFKAYSERIAGYWRAVGGHIERAMREYENAGK